MINTPEGFRYAREAKPLHGFIAKDMDTLRWGIERAWDMIADDVMIDPETGKTDYSKTYTRLEVAEIALDADHWRMTGSIDEEEFEIIMDMLRDLGWYSDAWKEVITETLPSEIYGY